MPKNPLNPDICNAPVELHPHNFTPITRTPWAGSLISSRLKGEVCPDIGHELVGECWEVSTDEQFPSLIMQNGLTTQTSLQELIQTFPEPALSTQFAGHRTSELLLKTLSADSPLSLQVHPADDDPDLSQQECGKPEAWLVLHSEPNCGFYLGFQNSITTKKLQELIDSGQDLKDLLQFVPVKAGDYFEIKPGTPHSIGPGVLLLEPQKIRFGKSGKTYRLWDWGRTYNERGQLDAQGAPRQLHVDSALRVMVPEKQFGESFVNSLRVEPIDQTSPSGKISFYKGSEFHTMLIDLHRPSRIKANANGYAVGLVLEGTLQWQDRVGKAGQPLFFPANCFPLELTTTSSCKFAMIALPEVQLADHLEIID